MPPLTVRAPAKVPADFWGKGGTVHYSLHGHDTEFTFPKSAEGEMLVVQGELVTGVLDKAVFGKFGLVHAVQVSLSPAPCHAQSRACYLRPWTLMFLKIHHLLSKVFLAGCLVS